MAEDALVKADTLGVGAGDVRVDEGNRGGGGGDGWDRCVGLCWVEGREAAIP